MLPIFAKTTYTPVSSQARLSERARTALTNFSARRRRIVRPVKNAYLVLLLWGTATLAVVTFQVKPGAQLVSLGLLVAVAFLRGLFHKMTWSHHPLTATIALIFLGASVATHIQIALWLSPPRPPDGHPVMPVGQTVLGAAVGLTFWGIVTWLYFKRLKREKRAEAIWLCGTILTQTMVYLIDAA